MSIVTIGVVIIAIFSITSHEAAHGYVADRLGDPTAREHGRLTLNPLPHIDPFFTILLPLVLILSGSPFIFGGAKPVPINTSRLRHPRRDAALVGAAGPAANIAIAAALTVVFALANGGGMAMEADLMRIAAIGIFVNALLAVFNLIPIPPLDGSAVIERLLPRAWWPRYLQFRQYSMGILLILVFLLPRFLSTFLNFFVDHWLRFL